jgi:hypothetical protein
MHPAPKTRVMLTATEKTMTTSTLPQHLQHDPPLAPDQHLQRNLPLAPSHYHYSPSCGSAGNHPPPRRLPPSLYPNPHALYRHAKKRRRPPTAKRARSNGRGFILFPAVIPKPLPSSGLSKAHQSLLTTIFHPTPGLRQLAGWAPVSTRQNLNLKLRHILLRRHSESLECEWWTTMGQLI